MKGLVLKDYYLLVKNGKMLLLVIFGFIILAAIFQDITFFVYYPAVFAGMLPMVLIQIDEKDKWQIYSHTLPYTKEQLVSVKYLVGLLVSVLIFILSTIAQFISMNIQGVFNATIFLQMLFSLFIMSLLGPALLLPFIFKLGAEKGRLIYYLVIGALMGISTQLTYEDKAINNDAAAVIPVVIAAIVIALYVFSWRLSITFYKKRDL